MQHALVEPHLPGLAGVVQLFAQALGQLLEHVARIDRLVVAAVDREGELELGEIGFDKVLKFDCGDDGVLVINGQEVTREDMDADCTIGVSLADLIAMANGELNPAAGFMQGKLKIAGDMGVAMKLVQIL